MTKVIDLTGAKEEKVLKPVQFVTFLDRHLAISKTVLSNSDYKWDKLYLLSSNYKNSGMDLMFASNDGNECLYLGKVNDGIL